jgi:GT2 family glycosyltransferase
MGDDSGVKLSYCVVNTNGREYLRACLDAIRNQAGVAGGHEILVLDNASTDGSVAVLERLAAADPSVRPIYLQGREGKAANDTRLLQEARGKYCLLLNEDSELRPGAAATLVAALEADPDAGAAGAQLLSPAGEPQACAWRLPGVGTALAQALFLHRWLVTQSGGARTRRVGWAQSAALLVRRDAAAAVGWLDPDFFVYSDETDFCKRLGEAGRHTLHVPAAEAVHHEQLSSDRSSGRRRIVEFHRNRDLYMRKHHGAVAAAAVRVLTAFSYLPRAVAAVALPGHDPRHYLLHAGQALRPHGEGLREAAETESTAATRRA